MPKINALIKELVEAGGLIEENGLENLQKQIQKQLAEKVGIRGLKQRIKNIVWSNKDVDKALQKIVRDNPELTKDELLENLKEEFWPLYPYIPFEMIQERAFWHRGATKKRLPQRQGKALPGIGRIGLDLDTKELKKFKIPNYPFDNPLDIDVRDPETWSLMILNGSNIGTKHGGDILGNVSRRALSDASERGDVAVIATNIISVDLKKAAGPTKVGRALAFGNNVNPALMEQEYRKIAERILAERPENEVIYQIAKEVVDDILNGWIKISLKPDSKPEYKGPIYIVLGNNENDLIKAAAYWEVRWWTMKKQNELKDEISRKKTARRNAEKRLDFRLVQKLTEEIEVLESHLSRTIISNVATQEWQRFYDHARAIVVKKIEKAIPNAKVIGQDTAFLKIGNRKVEIALLTNRRVTDALLSHYASNYGPKNLQEQLADTVVLCHPYALQGRETTREADYNGRRGSTKIVVAPIASDDKYLRSALVGSSSQDHQLVRAVFSEGFKPGVLRLNCVNDLINCDFMSVESLESFKDYPKKRRETKNAIYDRGSKFIWLESDGDPHYGGRAKEFVTCNIPGSDREGMRLDMTESVFEMMRQGGLCRNTNMRVHFFTSLDDQVQGQNFNARVQPHPHQLSYKQIEEINQKMMADIAEAKKTGDNAKVTEVTKHLNQFHMYQFEVRGSDFPQEQMIQMMERHVENNVDVFAAILRSAERAELIIKGVGEFADPLYVPTGFDTRNCGIINLASGNHLAHTVFGEIVEGPFYAKHLRALLAKYPEWKDRNEELEKSVSAPLYSGQFIGWSTLKIKGGYEYGLDIRDTPTRMAGWGDTLLGATRNMPMRGNYARIFNNRLPIICLYGDKHFFGTAITDCAVHSMCASGTHTDRYGENGFPPNNTGVSFLGVPAEGPEKGPILVRTLPFNVIKDFVEDNPRPFDWENFLPNPV
jgi:hypothetical protein